MQQDQPAVPATPIIRILKIGTCPNLSGKPGLGYHIGFYPESGICFRVASNDNGGYFSPEWVSMKAIQDALEKAPKPLTSFSLWPLFKGKSVNTPSFLFAALLAEGLVQRDAENPRVYVACPVDAFQAGMDALIASEVNLQVDTKITGKGAVKSGKKDAVPELSSTPKSKPRKPKAGSDKA
jgi:hypothetical protein